WRTRTKREAIVGRAMVDRRIAAVFDVRNAERQRAAVAVGLPHVARLARLRTRLRLALVLIRAVPPLEIRRLLVSLDDGGVGEGIGARVRRASRQRGKDDGVTRAAERGARDLRA